jgi:predicted nucleotidyltransferase
MSGLTEAQRDALRTLQRAYPDARIALIGAAALGLRLDMQWRNTADLDFAIAIGASDIDADKLRTWKRHAKTEHRWTTSDGVIVDLVPAPDEAVVAGKLIWPETGFEMNLVGVRQALECDLLSVAEDVSVRVATVPVIALLKMAAYVDRPHAREKDLVDLGHILDDYPDLDDDRLYDASAETGLGVPDVQGYVLGREMRQLADERDRKVVDDFLDMMNEDEHWSGFVRNSPWRYDEDQARGRLDAFTQAWRES